MFCSIRLRQLSPFYVRTNRIQTAAATALRLPYTSSRLFYSPPLPKPQPFSSSFTPSKTLSSTATPPSYPTLIFATFNGISRCGGSATRSDSARCLSSIPMPQPETVVDWNDSFHSSDVGSTGDDVDDRTLEEDTKLSIPVRAYFFSTSVDLKGLV